MDTIGYIQAHCGTPETEKDFVKAFREVFAGPPYFERHTRRYVRKQVWTPHLERGLIVLAYSGSEVAGFGCAIPLLDSLAAEIPEFLQARGFDADPKRTWYMSELGVLEAYRGKGIGARLVLNRLLRIRALGGTHYCLITASEGSNSEHLYRKIGAIEFGIDGETESRYFAGSCEEGISRLQRT
ncbi:MAG: GNAT family N-acetyltransferase [Patescibacteria group bacterium]